MLRLICAILLGGTCCSARVLSSQQRRCEGQRPKHSSAYSDDPAVPHSHRAAGTCDVDDHCAGAGLHAPVVAGHVQVQPVARVGAVRDAAYHARGAKVEDRHLLVHSCSASVQAELLPKLASCHLHEAGQQENGVQDQAKCLERPARAHAQVAEQVKGQARQQPGVAQGLQHTCDVSCRLREQQLVRPARTPINCSSGVGESRCGEAGSRPASRLLPVILSVRSSAADLGALVREDSRLSVRMTTPPSQLCAGGAAGICGSTQAGHVSHS